MKVAWAALVFFGCEAVVDLGVQRPVGPATMCVDQTLPLPCPVAPFRPMAAPATLDGLQGRWRLCGGTRHQPNGTPITTFHGTTVIELGQGLAFFNSQPGGALTRSLEHQLRFDPNGSRLTVTSLEGDEAVFKVASMDSPKVLRLSALDQWDFVPAE